MKKTIAIDVDEVLSASAAGFVAFSNQHWGTHLTIDDYDEHWAKMWNITEEETNERWRIYNEAKIVRHYEPLTSAKDILTHLSDKYRLVVATSRPMVLSPETNLWIDKYFSGIFSNIHHSGIYDNDATGGHTATKADMCLEIGADYLIDDQPKHCLGAAEVGLKAILFGDYPWNRNVELPDTIVRCRGWSEVLEYFNARD